MWGESRRNNGLFSLQSFVLGAISDFLPWSEGAKSEVFHVIHTGILLAFGSLRFTPRIPLGAQAKSAVKLTRKPTLCHLLTPPPRRCARGERQRAPSHGEAGGRRAEFPPSGSLLGPQERGEGQVQKGRGTRAR